MSEAAETLERELLHDLEGSERLVDEKFCGDLYRALAGAAWRKESGPDGRLALSWSRAEQVVNELRTRAGREPLALAQTGGEGEVSDVVADELGRRGWSHEPRGDRDPDHLAAPESPPPPGQGARDAPGEDAGDWERQAHAEAEEQLREHPRSGTLRQWD